MAMQKVKTGVYGLNKLLDGGINKNTVTAVIGSSGAGKTTLATYFLKRGVEMGEDAIFITLDEEPKQIIKEVIDSIKQLVKTQVFVSVCIKYMKFL